jgi:membrane peptidoglycan carboxypeptidase
MSQASAVTLIDMMRGVINRGTGTAIRYRFGINGDVAGKTGTTQNNADGWFILMHPNLVAGRLGRLQRQPRDDAQQLLGAGRPQRDPAGGRLLQDGAGQRQGPSKSRSRSRAS